MTVTAPPRSPAGDPAAEPAPVDPAALIEAARRRQRRRRRGLALVVIVLAAAAAVIYLGLRGSEKSTSPLPTPSPAPAARTIRLHLLGFGTPLPTPIDSGPCPQGRTEIAIVSAAGARVGTATLCVLTISKLEVPGWGLRRVVQTVREVDSLPGGTVVSLQQQTFWFARDQRHTRAVFRGRVVSGSGRYRGARGTVTGGGPGLNGKADWFVSLRLS